MSGRAAAGGRLEQAHQGFEEKIEVVQKAAPVEDRGEERYRDDDLHHPHESAPALLQTGDGSRFQQASVILVLCHPCGLRCLQYSAPPARLGREGRGICLFFFFQEFPGHLDAERRLDVDDLLLADHPAGLIEGGRHHPDVLVLVGRQRRRMEIEGEVKIHVFVAVSRDQIPLEQLDKPSRLKTDLLGQFPLDAGLDGFVFPVHVPGGDFHDASRPSRDGTDGSGPACPRRSRERRRCRAGGRSSSV